MQCVTVAFLVFECVRRRLRARETVADTCSICGACAVFDMHGLLAMGCQYMRIVEEVGRVIEAETE